MAFVDIEKVYNDARIDRRQDMLGDRDPENDVDYDEWIVIATVSHRAGLQAVWDQGYSSCKLQHPPHWK